MSGAEVIKPYSVLILPYVTSRPVSSGPKLSIETVSRLIFCCCSSLLVYVFHMFFLSGLSRLANLKNYNCTGLGVLSNLFGGVTSVRLLTSVLRLRFHAQLRMRAHCGYKTS